MVRLGKLQLVSFLVSDGAVWSEVCENQNTKSAWTGSPVDYFSSCSQELSTQLWSSKNASAGDNSTGCFQTSRPATEPSHQAITSQRTASQLGSSGGKINCSSPCRDGEMVSSTSKKKFLATRHDVPLESARIRRLRKSRLSTHVKFELNWLKAKTVTIVEPKQKW